MNWRNAAIVVGLCFALNVVADRVFGVSFGWRLLGSVAFGFLTLGPLPIRRRAQ